MFYCLPGGEVGGIRIHKKKLSSSRHIFKLYQ